MPGVTSVAMTVRVMLADDHTLVRSGMRALLEGAGFTVVGEAGDGREAVRMCGELAPDVIVMDVAMPNLNGIQATRAIREAAPDARVAILSMHGDRQYISESLRAGASAYLLKDSAFGELLDALREVLAGRVYLSRAVSHFALDDYVQRLRSEGAPSELQKLSAREREVLKMIAESKTSVEIGKALSLSVHTVDTHRRNMMEKLDIHSIVDLVKFALRHGLASLE